MTSRFKITRTEARLFRDREQIINVEIGALALSLAFASASTDAPQMFAFAAAFLVLLWMDYRLRAYNGIYRVWREVRHPFTRPNVVWKRFPLFHAGWLSLGLVASGIVNKNGFLGM